MSNRVDGGGACEVGTIGNHVVFRIVGEGGRVTAGMTPKEAIALAECLIKAVNTLPAEEERPND